MHLLHQKVTFFNEKGHWYLVILPKKSKLKIKTEIFLYCRMSLGQVLKLNISGWFILLCFLHCPVKFLRSWYDELNGSNCTNIFLWFSWNSIIKLIFATSLGSSFAPLVVRKIWQRYVKMQATPSQSTREHSQPRPQQ